MDYQNDNLLKIKFCFDFQFPQTIGHHTEPQVGGVDAVTLGQLLATLSDR